MEHYHINPFTSIKRKTPVARKVVWTKDNVCTFLDYAYQDFHTRNIGLIAQMAYEWCQRLGDMRVIKWENLELDKNKMHINVGQKCFYLYQIHYARCLLNRKKTMGFNNM